MITTNLQKLITSKTRRQLIYYLLENYREPKTIRTISRESGVNINSTVKELNELANIDLVKFKKQGTYKYAKINTKHPFFQPLFSCFFKSYGLGKLLIKNFYNNKNIASIIITKFYLEDIPKGKYDYDILFITEEKPNLEKIMSKIKEIELKLNKTLVFSILTTKEFKQRLQIMDSFVWSIFNGKFIFVLGSLYSLLSAETL